MREAQRSEPSPKEKEPSLRKQVQGDQKKKKEMAGPGDLKPKRRNIKKEKKPTARD